MTITRLLIVLATIFLGVASAQDHARQSENLTLGTRKFDFSKLQKQPPTNHSFSLTKPGQQILTLNPEVASTCYTMRTYVAESNLDKPFVLNPGPDEVAYNPPARNGSQPGSALTGTYTTCQPSSQFAVKKAVQTVESSNDSR
jgi:hypothetical protein